MQKGKYLLIRNPILQKICMCQENRTYVLNEFRQNCTFPALLMKNYIYYTWSVIDVGFSSAFHQNPTNMKNKH